MKHWNPLIQTITLNGFQIVRLPASRSEPQLPQERHFAVKNPKGCQREVIVEIRDEALACVERIAKRRLPLESLFWTECAESVLATYLWQEGRFPDRPLTIDEISRDEVEIAVRWETGNHNYE
jgi:hypothetical protein